MERLTFDGLFCDIAMCRENPCPCEGACTQSKVWERLKEYEDAEQDGRLVVLDEKIALCMCAGARAIENNKRLFGTSYCYDVFGKRGGPKEISYYEASNHLRDVAEPVLDREEAEAALAGKGGDG